MLEIITVICGWLCRLARASLPLSLTHHRYFAISSVKILRAIRSVAWFKCDQTKFQQSGSFSMKRKKKRYSNREKKPSYRMIHFDCIFTWKSPYTYIKYRNMRQPKLVSRSFLSRNRIQFPWKWIHLKIVNAKPAYVIIRNCYAPDMENLSIILPISNEMLIKINTNLGYSSDCVVWEQCKKKGKRKRFLWRIQI